MSRPLTRADRRQAFRIATRSFARWYEAQSAAALSDAELSAALHRAMGIFEGQGCRDTLQLTWQGGGLKIWASWGSHNHVLDEPIFAGAGTVAMAREFYRISDPADQQLSLL